MDLFQSVVAPSFEGRRYVRQIKDKGEYFFLDTEVIRLKLTDGHQTAAIAGRIVKNTKLKREQIYTDTGIVFDKKELETAPTSVFVLLLDSHRLIFCREVSGAPSIQNLESTSRAFLLRRHTEFIDALMAAKEKELGAPPPRGTKAKLLRETPRPDLRITPLADRQSLEQFVNRFKTVEELVIKLLPTNQEEIDNDEFWGEFGRRKDNMHSVSTTVRFANGKDGLLANEVIAQTSAATGLGNSSVMLRGHDAEGDGLKGNNEDFSLTIEVGSLPKPIAKAAVAMHNTFKKLTQSGHIALPALAAGVLEKIRALVDGQR
ncbi:MAG: hypothetical protein HZA63_09395 [Rhodocyclales bacterium]|nr:hypothetical protein [Rhodocyclales bacterium]